jgi:hypothetical protein
MEVFNLEISANKIIISTSLRQMFRLMEGDVSGYEKRQELNITKQSFFSESNSCWYSQ